MGVPVGPKSNLNNNKLLWKKFGSEWASTSASEFDNQALLDLKVKPYLR